MDSIAQRVVIEEVVSTYNVENDACGVGMPTDTYRPMTPNVPMKMVDSKKIRLLAKFFLVESLLVILTFILTIGIVIFH